MTQSLSPAAKERGGLRWPPRGTARGQTCRRPGLRVTEPDTPWALGNGPPGLGGPVLPFSPPPPPDDGVKQGLAEGPWLGQVGGPGGHTSFRPVRTPWEGQAPWALPLPAPDRIPEPGGLGAGSTHPGHEAPGLPHSGYSTQDGTQGQEPSQAAGGVESWAGTERRRVRGAPTGVPSTQGLYWKSNPRIQFGGGLLGALTRPGALLRPGWATHHPLLLAILRGRREGGQRPRRPLLAISETTRQVRPACSYQDRTKTQASCTRIQAPG